MHASRGQDVDPFHQLQHITAVGFQLAIVSRERKKGQSFSRTENLSKKVYSEESQQKSPGTEVFPRPPGFHASGAAQCLRLSQHASGYQRCRTLLAPSGAAISTVTLMARCCARWRIHRRPPYLVTATTGVGNFAPATTKCKTPDDRCQVSPQIFRHGPQAALGALSLTRAAHTRRYVQPMHGHQPSPP